MKQSGWLDLDLRMALFKKHVELMIGIKDESRCVLGDEKDLKFGFLMKLWEKTPWKTL